MNWKFASLLAIGLLFAAPVAAQERLVCFDPGTLRLSPDGIVQIRALAADFGPPMGGRNNLTINFDGSDEMVARRVSEIRLELMRNGVGPGRIRSRDQGSVPADDCLRASVTPSSAADPPYIGLWHFWGPYFDPGSDEVTAHWRNSMRFIVVDYEPGVTCYRLSGHADTAGNAEANLDLSRRRVENVGRELIRQGVRWQDIEVTGVHGESMLAKPTPDGVAEALNRRVQIDVRKGCGATPR